MDDARRPLLGITWALAASLLTAFFMVPWKLAVQHGPQSGVVLAMLTSAALFNTLGSVGGALVQRRRLRIDRVAIWVAIVLSALTYLGNVASVAAIARIGGPLLSVLQRIEVVVVALGAWALLGERVDARFWLGVAVAGAGLWVTGADAGGSGAQLQGVVYGMLSALAFGSMNIVVRARAHAFDPVTVNAMRLWLAVALWFAAERRLPTDAELAPAAVGYATLAALSGPVFARLSIMYALRHVEARLVALCLLTSPVLTLVVSWWLLDHWPPERSLWGGALMLLGVAIPVVLRLRDPAPTPSVR